MIRRYYTVTGMHCEACQRAVDRAVARLPGVTGLQVDLSRGRVTVDGDVPPGAVCAVIADSGYRAEHVEIA